MTLGKAADVASRISLIDWLFSEHTSGAGAQETKDERDTSDKRGVCLACLC